MCCGWKRFCERCVVAEVLLELEVVWCHLESRVWVGYQMRYVSEAFGLMRVGTRLQPTRSFTTAKTITSNTWRNQELRCGKQKQKMPHNQESS